MSDFKVNSKSFAIFQRIVKDKNVTKAEYQELEKSLLADKHLSDDEAEFLNRLKSGSDFTLGESSSETTYEFDSESVNFAQANRSMQNGLSSRFNRAFNQALKKGKITRADLALFKKSASTPEDFKKLQKFTGSEVTVEGPAGFREEWHQKAEAWELNTDDYRRMMVNELASSDYNYHRTLESLNHPNPKIKLMAKQLLNTHVQNGNNNSNLSVLNDAREARLHKSNPREYRTLKTAVKKVSRSHFEDWEKSLKPRLQEIKSLQDPVQKLAAYQRLSTDLQIFEKGGGVTKGNSTYRKMARQIKDEVKTHLAAQELEPRQHLEWLELQSVFDPKSAYAEMKIIALGDHPDYARETATMSSVKEQAMGHLIHNLPPKEASAFFMDIMEGQGNPSKEMQDNAAFYLNHVQKKGLSQYGKMLNSTREEVRRTGVNGLGAIETPKAVQKLMHFYKHGAKADEITLVESALVELKGSRDAKTAQAAHNALKTIQNRPKGQLNTASDIQGVVRGRDKAKLPDLLRATQDPALKKEAMAGLLEWLETSDDNTRFELFEKLKAHSPATEESLAILKTYGETDPPSVPGPQEALQKVKWLKNPQLQAKVLQETAAMFPEEKKDLEKALDHTYRQHAGRLSPEDQLALATAQLRLSPEKGAKAVSKWLPRTQDSEARKTSLTAVFDSVSTDPKLLNSLAKQALNDWDTDIVKLAVQALIDYKGGDAKTFSNLVHHADPELRTQAIDGLKGLAFRGDKASLKALEAAYNKSARIQDRTQLLKAIESLGSPLSQVAEASKTLTESLKTKDENNSLISSELKSKALAEQTTAKATSPLYSALRDIHISDEKKHIKKSVIKRVWAAQNPGKPYPSNPLHEQAWLYGMPYQPGISKKQMAVALIQDHFKDPAVLDDFKKNGRAHHKGELLYWLMKDKSDTNKALVADLLMSTQNVKDHEHMLETAQGSRNDPYDFKGYIGAEKNAEYEKKYQSLSDFENNFHNTTRAVMKDTSPDIKGDLLGKALLDYKNSLLTRDEAQHAIAHILGSFESPGQFNQALQTMLKNHHLTEAHLKEFMGSKLYDELSPDIGVKPAVKDYSSDQKSAQELNGFFQWLSKSKFDGDGDRSYERLSVKHPEVAAHPVYRKYFRDPTLADRVLISKLISQGKVHVSGVSADFMDHKLYGQSSMSIFAQGGSVNLANFLKGSVKEKAQQFLALDVYAKQAHDKTKAFLDHRAQELTELADDRPRLARTLKAVDDYLKPYQQYLMPGLPYPIPLESILKHQFPDQSDEDLKAEAQKIKNLYQYQQQYGTDPDKAAKTLRAEAKESLAMKRKLGVAGTYESNRSYFMRSQAFALYYNKDMDVLGGMYKGILDDLNKKGLPAESVLKRAASHKDDFAFAGEVISTLVGLATGTEFFIEAAKLGGKAIKHHTQDAGMVKAGVRSQALQDAAGDALLKDAAWHVIAKGVDKGFDAYKAAKVAQIEKDAVQKFGAKGLDQAKDYVTRETRKLTHEIALKKGGYKGFETALKDGDYSKAFSQTLISTLFHSQLKDMDHATLRQKATRFVAEKILDPTSDALNTGIEKVVGQEEKSDLLSPRERSMAQKFIMFAVKKVPNLSGKLNPTLNSRSEFEQAVALFLDSQEPKTQ